MQVKRFEGVDMQEVLRLVKHELGPNAVILSTRHTKRGRGAFGMFGRPTVEVTAAVDWEQPGRPDRQPESEERPLTAAGPSTQGRGTADLVRALDPLQRDMDQVKEILQLLATKERFPNQLSYPGLEREFTAVRKMLEQLIIKQQDQHDPLFAPTIMPFYQRLLSSGIDEILARRLSERVQNSMPGDKLAEERYVRGYFASTLEKAIAITGALRLTAGQQTAVALVGPTGVGKTTTIAKLAAHFALVEKKKVALVTLDTYRIAAVEQLRIFARLLNLPVDVVLTAPELDEALSKHRDKDLVLIDTAGRSQRDELQMAELKAFFAERQRASVKLVLSATASFQNLLDTIERFRPLNPSSLIFTKLDETNAFGSVFSTTLRGQLPLSYFTTGQRVPEDIEAASAERLVDLVLNISHWSSEEKPWREGVSA